MQPTFISLALVLLSSLTPAAPATDPPGQPFLVDTTGAFFWTAGQSAAPAAAFNGAVYLVTWQDKRNGSWDIYASRVRPDGSVVDSGGIPVCTASGAQQNPVVASDGSGFLVAWEDQRGAPRWRVFAARLDSSGRVLDTTSILLRSANGDKRSPAVAYGAGRYLVAWDEYYDSRNIVAAFVDTGGGVSEGIEVCAAPGTQGSPTAAYGDSLFLVAWDDARNGLRSTIYAARLTGSGSFARLRGLPGHDSAQRAGAAVGRVRRNGASSSRGRKARSGATTSWERGSPRPAWSWIPRRSGFPRPNMTNSAHARSSRTRSTSSSGRTCAARTRPPRMCTAHVSPRPASWPIHRGFACRRPLARSPGPASPGAWTGCSQSGRTTGLIAPHREYTAPVSRPKGS